jgi:hypothetical protein
MANEGPAISGKLLAGILALLVVIVGGYFGIRQWMRPPTQPSQEVGLAVAETFLASVRSGKAGEAWDSTTTEFKSIEGRESFIRKVRSRPILSAPLQFNSSQQVLIGEEPRTEYLFQSPDAKMVRILVGYERGDWKVDRLTL